MWTRPLPARLTTADLPESFRPQPLCICPAVDGRPRCNAYGCHPRCPACADHQVAAPA